MNTIMEKTNIATNFIVSRPPMLIYLIKFNFENEFLHYYAKKSAFINFGSWKTNSKAEHALSH